MTHNMLKLNTSKTELIVIANKQDLTKLKNTTLNIGDDTITPTPAARNIGVTMDSALTMVPHIKSCARSANYHLRNIGRVRKFLTTFATEQLVHALVTSRLDYANSMLINIPACHLQKLQLVQNTAARIITRTPKTAHMTPVLQSLHWLPIEQRIIYKVVLLTFKALHHMSPNYIEDMLVPYTPSRTLRSSHMGLLVIPSTRTKTYGTRAFSVAAPTLWNALPSELKLCQSLPAFKTLLKTHLFREAYNV